MIVEIDKETFFKYLIEVDDTPYQTVGASDFHSENNDVELSLTELMNWEDCLYFQEINDKGVDHYTNFYIVRPDPEWGIDGGKRLWYVFEGGCWSKHPIEDKWNPWPETLTCHMFGGWTRVRYTEIYGGYGFDEEKPFVDLIKHFENLRDIFKMKNIVGR